MSNNSTNCNEMQSYIENIKRKVEKMENELAACRYNAAKAAERGWLWKGELWGVPTIRMKEGKYMILDFPSCRGERIVRYVGCNPVNQREAKKDILNCTEYYLGLTKAEWLEHVLKGIEIELMKIDKRIDFEIGCNKNELGVEMQPKKQLQLIHNPI